MVGVGLVVANCGATSSKLASKVDPKYGVTASPRVVAFGEPVPKGGGVYRVGKPYQVAGRTYVPEENTRYREEGVASWYGDDFHGRLTANGEIFDMDSIAAAHPTLPMPCYVRVTNLDNRKSMIVRVNDRGPYHSDRVIDVSRKAADLLGFAGRGTARVRVEYVGKAPLEGSDDRKLVATLRDNGSAPMPVNSGVMVASSGALPSFTPSTARMPVSNVPSPLDRPFDLGEATGVASAEPVLRTQNVAVAASVAPAPRTVAAAPLPTIQTQRSPQVASAGMMPAARPAPAKPRAVAQAPLPSPVAQPPVAQAAMAQAAAQRPVRVASNTPMAPAAPAADSLAATGWMVGAQPVANYAPSSGIVTPVGTGRGLY